MVVVVLTLRFLLSHLATFRRMFWTLLLVGALDGAASFAVPILLAEFTKAPIATDILPRVLPVIAACLILSLFLQWCLRSWGESLTGWFGNELRLKLFSRAERLSLDTLSRYHSGYLAALINQVATTVGGLTSNIVWLFGHITTTLSLFVFFTARESIPLAGFNILILAVFVSVSVYLSRKIVPLADEKNKGQALVMERFIDLLTNISTVKRLGLRDWAHESLRRESMASDRSIFRFQRFHANRWCLLHAIFHISLLLTIAFLLYQVERGQASPSILILFIAGFARAQNQAERLSEMIKGLLEANAYVARLQEIVSEQRSFGTTTVSPFREIEFRGVSHRYANRSGAVSIPAFTLKAGERVLISGVSGQGKSTFLSILAHHLVPSQGDCLWNGTPYSQLDESLARAFALVSQEVELFDLSLRENLSLAASVSDEALVALLGELGLDDLMRALPEGLSTRVGEKGLRLSTGQKQRLNLARALLLNRPILLLDEPTAHLDKESEELVMRCLAKLPARTTVVIVSHHEALRSLCSRRFVFEGGVMRELAGG